MRIILNITSSIHGGAGEAAIRIASYLNSNNFKSEIYTKEHSTPWAKINYPKTISQKIKLKLYTNQLKHIKKKYSHFEHISLGKPKYPLVIKNDIEVLHLHWISDLIDFKANIEKLKKSTKIVWTLHDFNPITGGCHYIHGCDKYNMECQLCPQINTKKKYDIIKEVFENKVEFFNEFDIHLVCTSSYMYKHVQKSTLGKLAKSISVIPLSINQSNFHILKNKGGIREQLNIPLDKLVLGIGASNINRDIKGINDFLNRIERSIFKDKIHIISFGMPNLTITNHDYYTHLSQINSPILLNLFYSSCDYYLSFSKEEAFGQTIIEALCCGSPVISTRVGCAEDVIKEGQNGFFIENTQESVDTILLEAIKNKGNFNSENIRKSVLDYCDWEKIAQKYNNLYQEILKNN
ncbi:MAG: glycosyltransferase [Marinilabiliaceae bacterium]|nr:glycosyltransferase [Marinilabiliaceae bacterium]